MIFGYFVLLVALGISAVAAYYSIIGLTAIFAAATMPIIVMGVMLELGKITAAVWLKLNWHRASIVYKVYLIPAVAVLMLLTSMGIFGFLSKSHLDQTAPTAGIAAQVSLLDERIDTEKENINVARKALQQLDKTIDETIARSTSEESVARAANLRRSQQAERRRLQTDIENAQNNISKFTQERQPLAAQLRAVEAEVGPIKYIAALIYGDTTLDNNLLERAVRWVIIIIVAVFDPLALILIIAAQQSLRWAKSEKSDKNDSVQISTTSVEAPSSPPPQEISEPSPIIIEEPIQESVTEIKSTDVPVESSDKPDERVYDPVKYPYLDKTSHFENLQPMVAVSESVEILPTPEPLAETVVKPVVESPAEKIPETAQRYKAPNPVVPETMNVRRSKSLVADEVATKTDFGTAFPTVANKGDSFLRVDYTPNKLYKYNGLKWIEVDKTRSDSYSYNERYIDFLIEKIASQEYDIDQLSPLEQELIAEKLKRNNDNT